MQDQQFCPQCKSDSYLNPNIKIFVSPCYHRMCENCLSRIFSHGESECPECGTILRKVNFNSQTFEDLDVERECRIRKMLIKVYNRTEEDFQNEDLYEDYIEQFEDMVTELMEYKNDMVVAKKLDILRQESAVHVQDAYKKKKKQSQNSEQKTEKSRIVDPLEGVVAPSVILKKQPLLPSCFRFECPEGGYSKIITAYRAVYSLFDENI